MSQKWERVSTGLIRYAENYVFQRASERDFIFIEQEVIAKTLETLRFCLNFEKNSSVYWT